MSIPYRPHIDGLRALAVLSVVGFHAFPEFFPGGFIGVDVFFVISGYLITGILVKESSGGGIDLKSFYSRRIVRIFPALALVLLTCLVVGWQVLLAQEYKALGKHIALGATFVANFGYWFEAGYFDVASEVKPLLHLWSLGIEEQFYIFWPLALLLVLKTRSRASRWVGLTAVLCLALASVMVFVDRTHAFYAPWTRAWELLAGSLLALQMNAPSWPSFQAKASKLSLVALLVLLLTVLVLQARWPFPGMTAFVPVLCAVILIADSGTAVQKRVLSHPVLVHVGLISYPLYLWHWPALSFARILFNETPTPLVRSAVLLSCVVLAFMTYRYIEIPAKRLPRRGVVLVLLAVMALLGFLGKNIFDRDGLERIRHKNMIVLTQESKSDFVDFEKLGLYGDQHCSNPFKFPERDVCLTFKQQLPPTSVLFGDSHAVHAYWGLASALDRTGENLTIRGKGGCVPLQDFSLAGDSNHCQPEINRQLSEVISDRRLRQVWLAFRGRYLSPNSSAETVQEFRRGLEKTVAALVEAQKQVVLVMPVVEPGFDPRLCVGTLPMGRRAPHSCVIDKSIDDVKSEWMRSGFVEISRKYAPEQVRLLDPNDYFCSNGKCPIIRDGHSMFKDDNHLSYRGSTLLGESLKLSP